MNVRKERKFKKGLITETIFDVKFDDQWNGRKVIEVKRQLHNVFERAIAEVTRNTDKQHDFGRIFINHEKLSPPIVIEPQPVIHLTADTIMQEIERVLHSEEDLDINSTSEVHVARIKVPSGSGGGITLRNVLTTGQKDDRHRKRSMVVIKSKGNICMARSIAVCVARLEKDVRTYQAIRDSRGNAQLKSAMMLHKFADVPTNRPSTLMDIPKFEKVIKRRIVVFSTTTGNSEPLYRGTPYAGKETIFLYHSLR